MKIDPSKPVRIMERSIFSERVCFLENQLKTGQLSKAEYSIMVSWFNFAEKAFWEHVKPDVIGN
jgi:hypothetical protein